MKEASEVHLLVAAIREIVITAITLDLVYGALVGAAFNPKVYLKRDSEGCE